MATAIIQSDTGCIKKKMVRCLNNTHGCCSTTWSVGFFSFSTVLFVYKKLGSTRPDLALKNAWIVIRGSAVNFSADS